MYNEYNKHDKSYEQSCVRTSHCSTCRLYTIYKKISKTTYKC